MTPTTETAMIAPGCRRKLAALISQGVAISAVPASQSRACPVMIGAPATPIGNRISTTTRRRSRPTRSTVTVVSTDEVGTIGDVPTISRFYGIVIAMYFDDHGHPHFHARHAGLEGKIRVDQIEVIESTLEVRQLRLVLAWAELHQQELLENWRLARAGETLQEIEPLR